MDNSGNGLPNPTAMTSGQLVQELRGRGISVSPPIDREDLVRMVLEGRGYASANVKTTVNAWRSETAPPVEKQRNTNNWYMNRLEGVKPRAHMRPAEAFRAPVDEMFRTELVSELERLGVSVNPSIDREELMRMVLNRRGDYTPEQITAIMDRWRSEGATHLLHRAALAGSLDDARDALDAGANPRALGLRSRLALTHAAEQDHLDVAALIIVTHPEAASEEAIGYDIIEYLTQPFGAEAVRTAITNMAAAEGARRRSKAASAFRIRRTKRGGSRISKHRKTRTRRNRRW